MGKIAIREHKALTKASIDIFGDIVEKCFVSVQNYKNETVNEELNYICIDIDADDGSVYYADEVIYILFKNKKTVMFSNSEWATIAHANFSDLTLNNITFG